MFSWWESMRSQALPRITMEARILQSKNEILSFALFVGNQAFDSSSFFKAQLTHLIHTKLLEAVLVIFEKEKVLRGLRGD